MKTFFEPIPDHATKRQCAVCLSSPAIGNALSAATFWRYNADKAGNKDKSSRQPVCDAHAGVKL